MSIDLQWYLLRKNNAFVVKRVPEGPIFSKEPGNLKNIHSRKYSGLIGDKAISPHCSRRKRHLGGGPQTWGELAPARDWTAQVDDSSSVGTSPGARYRRKPGEERAALQRVTALIRAQQEKKPAPEKKVRGKKAAATA
ncbi:hypothetical protein FRC06_010613 [Ceratobasidium sp. 370]|nr:hypothetical protein FRC06_010613 [Ceratobasidium sp. 370]